MSSDTRVNLVVKNNTNAEVTCTNISCGTFTNLAVGATIAAGGTGSYTSSSNDRLFIRWEPTEKGVVHVFGMHEMAMTCPKSSNNSACGITQFAGLQTYEEHGTPVDFTFILGTPNLADWDDGSANNGEVVVYGSCSGAPNDGGPVLGSGKG